MNLSQIPKELLAAIVIIVGFFLFTLFDPPKTQCDVQLELFRTSQTNFVFPQDSRFTTHLPGFEKNLQRCQESNGPGGCYELFQNLKKFDHDLNALPQQCQATVADLSEIKKVLNQSIPLLIQLAWGSDTPISTNVKQGWLDTSEIYLFCRLKEDFTHLYGPEALNSKFTQVVDALPSTQKSPRPDVKFQYSIASINCKL